MWKVPELGKVELEIIRHKAQSYNKKLASLTMLSRSQLLSCFGYINYLVCFYRTFVNNMDSIIIVW